MAAVAFVALGLLSWTLDGDVLVRFVLAVLAALLNVACAIAFHRTSARWSELSLPKKRSFGARVTVVHVVNYILTALFMVFFSQGWLSSYPNRRGPEQEL